MATVTEVRTSWLTKDIKDCRELERFFPGAERRAETRCIIGKIQANPQGKQFLAKGDQLREAIDAGLKAANDAEVGEQGGGRPSPASIAAMLICERLGIDPNTLTAADL